MSGRLDRAFDQAFGEAADRETGKRFGEPIVSCPLGCTWAQPCAYHQRRIEELEDPDPDLTYEFERDRKEWP